MEAVWGMQLGLVVAVLLLGIATLVWRMWRRISLKRLVGNRPFPINRWFVRIVGMYEPELRALSDKCFDNVVACGEPDQQFGALQSVLSKCRPNPDDEPPFFEIHNVLTQTVTRAGQFSVLGIGEMVTMDRDTFGTAGNEATSRPVPILMLTRRPGSQNRKAVDVGFLQSLPEYHEAVFQVASNFSGIEAISQTSDLEDSCFCSNYIHDLTQGPAASISAGGAAIARVLTGLYSSSEPPTVWRQTNARQVNLLSRVLPKFDVAKLVKGYLVLDPTSTSTNTFPSVDTAELLPLYKVGYHRACQVTSGHRCLRTGVTEPVREGQTIDQVFAAAVNLAQGYDGRMNRKCMHAESITRLTLRAAYIGAYLGARLNGRNLLVLTLVGGGVFGNSYEWICDAIAEAHRLYGKHPLKRIVLLCNIPLEGFDDALRERQVEVEVQMV